jgi:hypothetical protein
VLKEPDKSWTSVDGVVAIATASAAFVALLVGLAALFATELRERVGLRPDLELEFNSGPPDAVRVMTRVLNAITSAVIGWLPTYYFRLRVKNNGRARADNVQVTVVGLQKYHAGSQEYVDEDSTLPLNLTWSNVGGTTVPSINRGMIRHCDLCHVQQSWPDIQLDQTDWPLLFRLNTEVTPNPISEDNIPPTLKAAGRYRLVVVVSADNAPPHFHNVTIDFSGQWSDDRLGMFDEVTIAVTSSSVGHEM